MAVRSAETIRQSMIDYAKKTKDREFYAAATSAKISEPIFSGFDFHADEEPDKDGLARAIEMIGVDALTLDTECQGQADDYATLITNTTARLKDLRSRISAAGQKANDINVLCGNYPEFTNIISIEEMTESSGAYGGNSMDGTFSAAYDYTSELVNYTVANVTGNGYEGNQYAVLGGKFLNDTNPASDRKLMTDSILETAYEYSRILSKNTSSDYAIAQKDGQQAACTIEAVGAKPFNLVKIYSDSPIMLNDIAYYDGTRYAWLDRPAQKLTEKAGYAAIQATIPQSLQAKISLSQTTVSSDIIGINTDSGIKLLPDADRSVIRIHAIDLISAEFYKKTVYTTGELLKAAVDSVAVLATEYAPTGSIEYILTVNGKDYTVVPMNSQKTGTKVIRYNAVTAEDDYVTTISEKITSASLTVCINTANSQETPFVSNLRICIGGTPE